MSREPEIAFACPHCGHEAVASIDGRGHCPACTTDHRLEISASLRDERIADRCPACSGVEFYVQRDFNQKAGLAVVIVGSALAPFTPYYSSLFAAAFIDAVLYLLLPEITICYRCQAHFRGLVRNPRHHAFDLHTAEQYDVKAPPPA